jgi:cbb3-type cytochrome oxidase cytochrome c subunit
MAATDQTFRNQRVLHIVFGVTSLAMFFSVIWMMVQDYNREFKAVQRKFRDVEAGINERLMLDQLPERAEVDKRVTEIADARAELEKVKQQVRSTESALAAQRDAHDTDYRMKKATFDSRMSYLDIWTEKVGNTPSAGERAKLERERDAMRKEIEDPGGLRDKMLEAKRALDTVEKKYKDEVRSKLDDPEKRLSDAEDNLKKLTTVFDRFGKTAAQKQWGFGDTFRELPIIDAFASPVKIQQTKLNDLTIDYSFKDVPRFDRCTTCHLGIDRATFDRASLAALGGDPKNLAERMQKAHEIFAQRQKAGEDLGFDPGAIPTKPTVVKLTPGQITQYMAHPRLDLFVDSNSPHPMQQFGCTICHAGQGSSTEFVLASHTPNDSHQEEEWQKGYDWESNHYWDFPMHAARFVESSCVKCHHELTDLIRNGVKPEAPKLLKGFELVRENGCFGCHDIPGMKSGRSVGPDLRLEPAPALEWLSQSEQERVRGENPGAMRKVGPSMRRIAEKTNPQWARKWILSPRSFRDDTKMPHFYNLSTNSREYLEKTAPEQKDFRDAEIHSIAYYLFAESQKHLEGKDTYRNYLVKTVGEMQAQLAEKGLSDVKRKELSDSSRNLGNVGLLSAPMKAHEINEKLAEQKQLQDRIHELRTNKEEVAIPPLATRLTKVTEEIVEAGKPTPIAKTLVDGEGNVVADADLSKGDAVNGRRLFTERGCLACHANDATTKPDKDHRFAQFESHQNFGPNLTRIAAKLGTANEQGAIDEASKKRWLVQWIMSPNVHHPRTRMPVTFLRVGDANDVAEWLLSQTVTDYNVEDPQAPGKQTLVALARVYLGKSKDMTQEDVDKILPANGDPNAKEAEERLKYAAADADEQILRGGEIDEGKLKWYIGKKSISRLGCYGCHDMPGFELAKPIGTVLNDWGKKDPERLAFEDVDAFVKAHFNITPLREPAKEIELREKVKRLTAKVQGGTELTDAEKAELKEAKAALEGKEMRWDKKDGKDPYDKYFYESLEHHGRNGFLNQKLLEPRSYDYGRIRSWDDRLRMPQFQFARVRRHRGESDEDFEARKLVEEAEAREAVMTFVLGLVAEPIPLKYVHKPGTDRLAEVKGRQVLDKYNCAGCHQVQPGRYEFKKTPATLEKLQTAFERAKNTYGSDHFFADHNAWVPRPQPFADRFVAFGVQPRETDEGFVVRLAEALRFTGTDGATRDLRQSGSAIIAPEDLIDRSDPWGGTFPEIIIGRPGKQTEPRYPDEPIGYLATHYEQRFGDKPDDARSALPPPLVREGERVQPRWLYQFLLNPQPIRPQSFMLLRMPRFNMSPDEAMTLVNYFGAVSRLSNPDANVTLPYLKIDQRESAYWRQKAQDFVRVLESRKELDNRMKQMEPVWKEQVEAVKKELEAQRDELKKAVDMENDAEAKKQRQEELKAVEGRLAKVSEQVNKGDFSGPRDKWKQEDAYAVDAYRLLTNKEICMKCHSIGRLRIEGEIGPNLELVAERLRPEWTMHWIANPNRLFTYSTQMPQNFPGDKIQWQESFQGSSLDQVKAVRDALMDLQRLADMPANRSQRVAAPGGGK